MALAVVLIIVSVVVLLFGGMILGLFILGVGDRKGRNVFSARQDWMNSHVEENE